MTPRTPAPAALLALLATLALALAPAAAQNADAPTPVDPVQQEARAAAEEWLAHLDAGEYNTGWEKSAEPFRQQVGPDVWAEQAAAIKTQVGDVEYREFRGSQTMTDPPGAPPGEYMQLRYDTEFLSAGAVTEVVVVVREAERGWRVVGYFFQPPA